MDICCNKNFQILHTSGFHRLVDNADQNHNCITSFYPLDNSFRSLYPLSHLFPGTKDKNLKKKEKKTLCVESKVEFSGEMKFKTNKN